MKAFLVEGPQAASLHEIDNPEALPGWVVAKVEAMGLCGTDIHLFQGDFPYFKSGTIGYPLIPGHEWVGRIVAVGENVAGFAIGDRITGETHIGCGVCASCLSGSYQQCPFLKRVGIGGLSGACAEYIVLPAKALHRVPPEIPTLDAILLEPASVVHFALSKACFKGGERVVIFGPGNLGLLGVSIAKALGAAEVILVGTKERRLAIGANLGADRILNIEREGDKVVNLLADSADIVLEASGAAAVFPVALNSLRRGGALCMVSLYHHQVTQVELNRMVTHNLRIIGSLGSPGIWEGTIALMVRRGIETTGLVTHQYPLEKAVDAFRTALAHRDNTVKVAIVP